MRSLLMLVVLVVFQLAGFAASADSFYVDQNGKRYLCEQVSGGDGSCWEKCPYTFSTCADSCGGGDECWEKCPYTFSTCANTCGGGKACWDKCPYTFSTCASTCGQQGLTANVLQRLLNTHNERLQAEKEKAVTE